MPQRNGPMHTWTVNLGEMQADTVYHFSEDPSIKIFTPHVPLTNPSQPPAVWAIDAEHAPLYWFPRDCPRVTAWPRTPHERRDFERVFETSAPRVHAIESAWLDAMESTRLYRYSFDATAFTRWDEAAGHFTSTQTIEPLRVEPVGELLALHAQATIDFRVSPSLWAIYDLAVSDAWEFSIVRMGNAQPRT